MSAPLFEQEFNLSVLDAIQLSFSVCGVLRRKQEKYFSLSEDDKIIQEILFLQPKNTLVCQTVFSSILGLQEFISAFIYLKNTPLNKERIKAQLLLLYFVHSAVWSNFESHKGSVYSIQSCQRNDHT